MAVEVVGVHNGYDGNGYPMHSSPVDSTPNLSSPSPEQSNPHTKRFLFAISAASALSAVACAYHPAVVAAIPFYVIAVNEARQIPELN